MQAAKGWVSFHWNGENSTPLVSKGLQKAAFNATSKLGDSVVLTALKDWTRLTAVGWNEPGKQDKPRKVLISTCGVTVAAEPRKSQRWILNTEQGQMEDLAKAMEIPCLCLTAAYFSSAPGIDVFNHARQGGFQ